MADVLNYQASHSAVYYSPPRKWSPLRTLVGGAIGMLVIVAVSYAYSISLLHVFSLLPRLSIWFGFAMTVSIVGGCVVRHGQISRPLGAAVIAAALTLVAIYCSWIFWVYLLLRQLRAIISLTTLVWHPVFLYRIIVRIHDVGAWQYNNQLVNGIPLLLVWMVEAVVVLWLGTLVPIKMISKEDPVCDCGARTHRVPGLPRFADDRETDFVNAVESQDFSALVDHPAASHPDNPELSLVLMACPGCRQMHVLTVNRIAWVIGKNGRGSVQVKPLISRMLIPPTAAGELRLICDKIQLQRKQSASAQ